MKSKKELQQIVKEKVSGIVANKRGSYPYYFKHCVDETVYQFVLFLETKGLGVYLLDDLFITKIEEKGDFIKVYLKVKANRIKMEKHNKSIFQEIQNGEKELKDLMIIENFRNREEYFFVEKKKVYLFDWNIFEMMDVKTSSFSIKRLVESSEDLDLIYLTDKAMNLFLDVDWDAFLKNSTATECFWILYDKAKKEFDTESKDMEKYQRMLLGKDYVVERAEARLYFRRMKQLKDFLDELVDMINRA